MSSSIRGFVRAFLAAAFLLNAAAPAARADVRQANNSRVMLDVPANFAVSTRFAGFQDDKLGASIVVNEFPLEAYEAIERGFTPEALQQKGIVFVSRSPLGRDDPHLYIRARQNAGGQPFEKYFAVFKASDATVLLSANVPQHVIERGELKHEAIEAMLRSAKLGAAIATKPLFVVSQLGRFKPAGRLAGTAEAYTLSGRLAPGADGIKEPAIFIVAPALDKRPIADPAEFAERALRSTPGVTELAVTKKEAVTIGGLKGIEIEATAIAKDEDKKLLLYQVVLVEEGGGYFRLLGTAPARDGAAFLADFRAMANSFAPIRARQ